PGPQALGRPQRPPRWLRLTLPPRLFRRGRRRAPPRPLRQAHQRLLPGQLAFQPLVLLARRGEVRFGVRPPTPPPRLARIDQAADAPFLQLIVARQRDAQCLGGLRRCPRPGPHLPQHRRQPLRLPAPLGGAVPRPHDGPPSAGPAPASLTSPTTPASRISASPASNGDSPGPGGSSDPSSKATLTTPWGVTGAGRTSADSVAGRTRSIS